MLLFGLKSYYCLFLIQQALIIHVYFHHTLQPVYRETPIGTHVNGGIVVFGIFLSIYLSGQEIGFTQKIYA
ncbi:MAG: hypothetical protein F6J92_17860 [Symploca sp. SIO1A3]|nr:hypothetical protein [Symploca sp. SIO1A3]